MFGDANVAIEAAQKSDVGAVNGGVSFNDTEKGVRAVIYAAETANFSTFAHEVAHIWRQQLTGDLKTQAENAFGVEKGQWTREQEEKFAVGFEDYLRTGRAQNNELKNLYQKLAEYISRVYHALKSRIDFTKDIDDVYAQLMQGDDSILAAAERAVAETERQEADQKSAQDATPAQNERTAQNNAEDDIASTRPESSETVQEAEEAIKDPDVSTSEKAEAALDAAGKVYAASRGVWTEGPNGETLLDGEPAVLFQSADEAKQQLKAVRTLYEGTDSWLTAPNGKRSNLDEQQWLTVRTPNFKRYFGNWDYDPNTKINVTKIDTSKLPFDYKNTASVRQWLIENLIGKTVTNTANGTVINFNSRDTRASIKRRGEIQRGAYTALDKLIENAVYFDFEKNDGQAKHSNLYGQDIYYAALEVGNKIYSVRIKINISAQNFSGSFKDHKVSEIEIAPYLYHSKAQSATYAGIDAIQVAPTGAAEGIPSRTASARTVIIGDIVGDVNPSVSKAIDENGEPKVVYHGTNAVFDTFKKTQQNDAGRLGRGFYFTGEYPLAGQYGKILPAFLNVRNPYYMTSEEHESLAEADSKEKSEEFTDGLITQGYDGVYFNGDLNDEWNVFDPHQIKSATQNKGNFDAENPSMLFQSTDEKQRDTAELNEIEELSNQPDRKPNTGEGYKTPQSVNEQQINNGIQTEGISDTTSEPAHSFGNPVMINVLQDILSVNNTFRTDANGILFQTQEQQPMKEAASFDSWQEFMDYYMTDAFEKDTDQVPSDADARWYETTRELAKGISPTTQEQEDAEKTRKSERDDADESRPEVMDALFIATIERKGELEKFLRRVDDIRRGDFIESTD